MVSTGGMPELGENAAQLRLEAPLLGGRELGRNRKIHEVEQRLVDALESLLGLGGKR